VRGGFDVFLLLDSKGISGHIGEEREAVVIQIGRSRFDGDRVDGDHLESRREETNKQTDRELGRRAKRQRS
jgi:hypothetical protein